MSRRVRVLLWVLAGLVPAAALALAVVLLRGGPPDGPVPVAWDAEACAQCRMLVSEPGFAAQLHLADGRVLNFDDPGDAFTWMAEHDVQPHALWFHHVREDRWIPASEVAFERVEPTPMGYGLGAVDAGTEGALDLEEARRHALEVEERHRRGEVP